MTQEFLSSEAAVQTTSQTLPTAVTKRAYTSPASVQLSGSTEEEYGCAIAAVAVWVIGIGPAWIW